MTATCEEAFLEKNNELVEVAQLLVSTAQKAQFQRSYPGASWLTRSPSIRRSHSHDCSTCTAKYYRRKPSSDSPRSLLNMRVQTLLAFFAALSASSAFVIDVNVHDQVAVSPSSPFNALACGFPSGNCYENNCTALHDVIQASLLTRGRRRGERQKC